MSDDRSPRDLLGDFAERAWGEAASRASMQSFSRPDGLAVTRVHCPVDAAEHISAHLVVQPDVGAALIVASGAAFASDAADAAAAQIASTLRFIGEPAGLSLGGAHARGGELATTLATRGARPWFPGDDALCFAGLFNDEWQALALWSEAGRAPDDDVVSGGHQIVDERRAAPPIEMVRWTLEADATGFSCARTLESARGTRTEYVQDTRTPGSDRIQRRSNRAGRTDVAEFPVGPNFICHPLEHVAAAWVAQQNEGAWLIATAAARRPGTTSAVLRPLAPDAAGLRRVLWIDDYWPRGVIYVFDHAQDLVRIEFPHGMLQRVPLETAVRRFPGLRPLQTRAQ